MKKYWLLLVLALIASHVDAQTANSLPSQVHRDKNKTETKLHPQKLDPGSPKAHHLDTPPAKTSTSASQDELLRAERNSNRAAANHAVEKPAKVAPLKDPAPSHGNGTNFNYRPPKQNNVQPNPISNRPQQRMSTPHR